MAPVKFTKPPDLSGRTPLYRLSKSAPESTLPPAPPALSTPVANYPPPYHAPYNPANPPNPPYTPSQPPHDDKENAPTHTPQTNANSPAQGSPMTKRRGRKLQEHETLILVNCCLEYQSLYRDNPSHFWHCVATSLKRQIKRNFSWQSCRQIIEELVSERRDRRRDVAAGKAREQPLTELVLATDKWISFSDAATGAPSIASPAQSLKRPAQSDATSDPDAAKRPRQLEQPAPSVSPLQPVQQPAIPTHPIPPNSVPTIPSGPTMSEFQTLKVDIQSLRMDVQTMRRDMIEVRNELNNQLGMILQSIQQVKAQAEAKEK
ncbi:hypothetical protein BDW62DRAFT_144480 [Aspergillus aurantiobrunneus]